MTPEPIPALRPVADLERVRRALGGSSSIPPEMTDRFEQLAYQLVESATPQGRLAVAQIEDRQPSRVRVEGGLELEGLGVAGLARKCDLLAALVVSLGPGPERLMAEANQRGDLVGLTLLDAIASEVVEDLAEQAQEHVRQLFAQQDRAITRRYSPGYCDWVLEDQVKLDQLVGFADAGVRLSSDCIMIPEKSISAVIGIGPAGSIGATLTELPACGRCPKKPDCPGPNAT